jgi:prepilin-type N-terminal cleavage/methylation domain-containing protein
LTIDADSWSIEGTAGGFTLIEVIGALVIFSVGVLMVMQVGGALTTQTRYAGTRSELVVLANERLDSIAALPLASITTGTTDDTVAVQGWSYQRVVTITVLTAVLARIDVTLARVDGAGPAYSVTSYTSDVW